MIDLEKLEGMLSELPLYGYFFLDPKQLEFSGRMMRSTDPEGMAARCVVSQSNVSCSS